MKIKINRTFLAKHNKCKLLITSFRKKNTHTVNVSINEINNNEKKNASRCFCKQLNQRKVEFFLKNK